MTSPPGGSTLITSAPKSARICVAYGPITTVVRSSTRTPASGPLMPTPKSGTDHDFHERAIAASCCEKRGLSLILVHRALGVELREQLARLRWLGIAQHALRGRLHLAQVGAQDALLDRQELRRVHREVAQAQA